MSRSPNMETKRHPAGRLCVECECTLSIYNPDPICASCKRKLPASMRKRPRMRGRKAKQ